MRLGRRQALRPAIIEHAVIEVSGPHLRVEPRQRGLERRRVELQRDRKLPDRAGLDRREHWGNEFAHRLGIDDREADLIWLFGDEAAPYRVALRPEILTLVMKTQRVFVDHDAERDAIHARANSAIELR